MDPALELAVNPPLATAALPGIGGTIRGAPEDFRVEEIAAYEADGRPGHLLVTLEKRGFTTDDAVREVARQLGVPQRDVGIAGKKDKFALTRQRISLPGVEAEQLADFAHTDIRLSDPASHGHKLRRGHLHGNRFEIVIRELPQPDTARAQVEAKLVQLRSEGLPNYYGPQRFGFEGKNALGGLAGLRAKRRPRRGDFRASAAQSAMFNLYVVRRREAGRWHQVLAGDVLSKTESGGLFVCTDPAEDQPRLEAGELCITGPMFGSKMRSGPEDSDAGRLEAAVLAEFGLDTARLRSLGKSLLGTRRRIALQMRDLRVRVEDAHDDALCTRFTLPPGSYATVLLGEWMRPARS